MQGRHPASIAGAGHFGGVGDPTITKYPVRGLDWGTLYQIGNAK